MKKQNVVIIILIFISILSIVIIHPLTELDEMWNYNTSRVVAEGLIPYRDISMITTPLLPIITALVLKITFNEIIISRILTALLWSGILFTIYKIFKEILKEENISLIATTLLAIIFRKIYYIDYNIASLFIVLIILYQEIKNIKKEGNTSYKYNFIIGFLTGLIVCTKQTIGITTIGITLVYNFIFIKENKERIIKNILIRIIGILIPIIIMFIYLIINEALKDFIEYAVLGIKTFSNKIPYARLFVEEQIELKYLAGIMPISLIIMFMALFVTNWLEKSEQKIILTILLYSFAIIIVMYPITDGMHFLIRKYNTIYR